MTRPKPTRSTKTNEKEGRHLCRPDIAYQPRPGKSLARRGPRHSEGANEVCRGGSQLSVQSQRKEQRERADKTQASARGAPRAMAVAAQATTENKLKVTAIATNAARSGGRPDAFSEAKGACSP